MPLLNPCKAHITGAQAAGLGGAGRHDPGREGARARRGSVAGARDIRAEECPGCRGGRHLAGDREPRAHLHRGLRCD